MNNLLSLVVTTSTAASVEGFDWRGLSLEWRLTQHHVVAHNRAKDFPVTALSIHKRQRLEKSNPFVQMDRDHSGLFELLEDFATIRLSSAARPSGVLLRLTS
jgi:hypothetical protein